MESLLRRIKDEASLVVQTDPIICDRLGYPGHHPGMYSLEESFGNRLYTREREEIYDASNFWVTLPINIERWFQNERDLVSEIGLSALRAATMSEFATPYQALFLKKISDYWPKADKVLTYPAGTLATDGVVKWMVALMQEKNHYTQSCMRVVAAESAFHGRAGYAAELTRTSRKSEDWQTGWAVRIPDPTVVFDDCGEVLLEETQTQVNNSLESLKNSFEKIPSVAGLIIEYPFMAEGGVLLVNDMFLEEARKLCDIHGKIMAIDCVQMFGRGWFFPQKAMETADAIAIGKTSRVPAAVLTDPKKRGFVDHANIPGKYGATWAGLESQILSALAIFKIIEENNLFEEGTRKAEYFYKELKAMAKAGAGILKPRISGTYIGFDLESTEVRQRFVDTMRAKHNIILLPAGDSAIRLSPRLDITSQELDYLLTNFEKGLSEIKASVPF